MTGITGLVLGVDPGAAGAVALLTPEGDLIDVVDLPVLPSDPGQRAEVNASALAEIVRDWAPAAAFVELVGPRPTDGAKQAFAFGAARSAVETTLLVLGVRLTRVAPQVWKRHHRIPSGRDQKGAARVEATRRWPRHAGKFARVKDDGRAKAGLIAVAGLQREARQA